MGFETRKPELNPVVLFTICVIQGNLLKLSSITYFACKMGDIDLPHKFVLKVN